MLGVNFCEDNMIKYGVVFGLLMVEVYWVFGECMGSIMVNLVYGVGVNYFVGLFGVGIVYDEVKVLMVVEVLGLLGGNEYVWDKCVVIVVSYIMGFVKVMVGFCYGNMEVFFSGVMVVLMLYCDDFYWLGVNY